MLYFDVGGSVLTRRCGAVAKRAASMARTHYYYWCYSSSPARHFSLFRHYQLLRQQVCLAEQCLTERVFARQSFPVRVLWNPRNNAGTVTAHCERRVVPKWQF